MKFFSYKDHQQSKPKLSSLVPSLVTGEQRVLLESTRHLFWTSKRKWSEAHAKPQKHVQVTLGQPYWLPTRDFKGLLRVSKAFWGKQVLNTYEELVIWRHSGSFKPGFPILGSGYSLWLFQIHSHVNITLNLIPKTSSVSESSFSFAHLKAK